MLDRTLNFSTLLPINGVLLLPATVSNIGTHTINFAQYWKMHTAEQKIAHNNEKNSTDGYKNCEHLSTNAHPPVFTIYFFERKFWKKSKNVRFPATSMMIIQLPYGTKNCLFRWCVSLQIIQSWPGLYILKADLDNIPSLQCLMSTLWLTYLEWKNQGNSLQILYYMKNTSNYSLYILCLMKWHDQKLSSPFIIQMIQSQPPPPQKKSHHQTCKLDQK